MNRFIKNITRTDYKKALSTEHEKREQLLPEVVDDFRIGRYAALMKADKVEEYFPEVKKWFSDLPDVTLKIFFNLVGNNPKEVPWANRLQCTIYDASIIQNIFAEKGLAPKVYDFIEIEDQHRRYVAQVTVDLGERTDMNGEDEAEKLYATILDLSDSLDISVLGKDQKPENMVANKWVDFQGFVFGDKKNQKKKTAEFLFESQRWQSNVYQSIDELDIQGVRGKNRIPFFLPYFHKDKKQKVLDLGCSGGEMCNLAVKNGAVRVVGADLPDIIPSTRRASNFIGNFKIDYYNYNLKDEEFYKFLTDRGHEKFDIIFFLSMEQHIGLPQYLKKFMHKDSVILFESNCYKPLAQLKPGLEKKFMLNGFNRVEHLGDINDLGARALYKLQI